MSNQGIEKKIFQKGFCKIFGVKKILIQEKTKKNSDNKIDSVKGLTEKACINREKIALGK